MTYKRECVICGTQFISTQKNQICCSFDCAQERTRIISRWYKRKKRIDQKKEIINKYMGAGQPGEPKERATVGQVIERLERIEALITKMYDEWK